MISEPLTHCLAFLLSHSSVVVVELESQRRKRRENEEKRSPHVVAPQGVSLNLA